MKLHLPKMLLGAVLACLATAFGDEYPTYLWDFSQTTLTEAGWSEGAQSVTFSETGSPSVTLSTTSSNGLSYGTTTYTLTDARVTTLNDNVGLTGTDSISSTQGTYISAGEKTKNVNLTLTITGLEADSTYNVSLISGLDFEGAGSWNSLTTTNTYAGSDPALTAQSVPVKALGSWALANVKADSTGTITFTLVDTDGKHTSVFNGLALVENPASTLTWGGTDDHHTWSDAASWQGGSAFSSGDMAVFGADAANKTVVIDANVTASSVTVEGEYTFQIASGVAFSGGAIEISGVTSSLSLQAADTTSRALGTITGEGALYLESGTYTIGNFASGTVAVEGATLNLEGSSHTIADVVVGEGGVVTTTNNSGNGCVTGDISILAGGTFKVNGGHDAFGYNNGRTDNIVMEGENGKLAVLELNQTSDNSVTMSTNITMNGYSHIKSKDGTKGFNTYGGSISISGTDNVIDVVDIRSNATISVEADGALAIGKMTLNKENTTKVLTKTGDGSLTFTGEAAMKGLNVNGGTVTMQGATDVQGSITVASGATLVNEGTLNVNSAITSSGTVTFSGDVTATGLAVTEGSTGYTDITGAFSTSGNGFETTTGSSVTLVNGGTVNANGHTVTQGEVTYTIQNDGTAVAGNSVTYSTYYQTEGSVSTSDIAAAAAGHGLFTTAVVSGTGVLEVNSSVAFITADGGEVHIGEGGSYEFISVAEDAVVSGNVDYSSLTIDEGKTATMKDGINEGGVTFSRDGGVQVQNVGDDAITYSTSEADAKVTADKLTAASGQDVAVNNKLAVDSISNEGAGTLTVTGLEGNLTSLAAKDGSITLQNVSELEVTNLTLEAQKAVSVYQGESGAEGIIKIAENGSITSASGSMLNSDLVIGNGVTLDFTEALTLGSQLTVGEGVLLGDTLMTTLNGLAADGTLNLVTAKAGSTLTFNGVTDGAAASTYFNTEKWDNDNYNYNIVASANDGVFGIVKSAKDTPTPEPTTGTLSLLALAGLMARRRRK